MLKLYNTKTRKVEYFTPLDKENVRLYACGPTVYDFAHIGNARPLIVFDLLFRLLKHHFGEKHVTYVRNITDVDDKINTRAFEEKTSIGELTARTIAQFHEDSSALGILPVTYEPRATQFIAEMRELIETLVIKNHAYVAEDHVLFDVNSFAEYGKLSNRSLDEMQAGARVEVAPYKRNAMDFVLWKPSLENMPGWDSPCGIEIKGRPGWHIECSAMSKAYLGDVFDIHGGGVDLVFPHHENECAQSCAANGTSAMAQIWMHNGFLQVEGKKMSKSLGNFLTINALLKEWPGEVLRFNMLRTHYRQPIDWTIKALQESRDILTTWYRRAEFGEEKAVVQQDLCLEVLDALNDDLNTPKAIAAMHQLDSVSLGKVLTFLGFSGKLDDPREKKIDTDYIEALIAQRNSARKEKNFKRADELRDTLNHMGIELLDRPGGTDWELKN